MLNDATCFKVIKIIYKIFSPYLTAPYGEKVKAYLIKGAKPLSVMKEYPNPILGWGVLCLRDSLPV
jgi:hypothetical protein